MTSGHWQMIFLGVGLTIVILFLLIYREIFKKHPFLLKVGMALILMGMVANTIVVFANGGYMPSEGREVIGWRWMPMEGATLTWLGDYLFGGWSPGDMGILAGLFLQGIGIVKLHLERKGENEFYLSPRQLLLNPLKAFICLPAVIFILFMHNLGDFLAGVKSEDKWAKLREPRR